MAGRAARNHGIRGALRAGVLAHISADTSSPRDAALSVPDTFNHARHTEVRLGFDGPRGVDQYRCGRQPASDLAFERRSRRLAYLDWAPDRSAGDRHSR